MNKYSLQTTIFIYISLSAVFIASILAVFVISDHKKSLEQNLLYKMHIIAHDVIEHKLYLNEKEMKNNYIKLQKNFHESDVEALEAIEFALYEKLPTTLPYLHVHEEIKQRGYLVLSAGTSSIETEIQKLLLELTESLLLVLAIVLAFFHLLLKKLLHPLQCLVTYCHNSHNKQQLALCSGSYEINALKDAIVNLQQKNQLLCKEKQDIFKEAAHEIKTPISILKARLDLFAKSDMDKKEFLQESNNDIHTISNKLRELIFLKAIEWDIRQEKELVPMQNQCTMMQELFKPILAKKELHMISNLEGDFSLYIHKEAIGRVMQAIFENIFMHTKNGTTINTFVDAKKYELKIVNEIDEKSDEVLFSSHIGTKLIQRLADKLDYTYDAYEEDGLFYTIISFKGQEK